MPSIRSLDKQQYYGHPQNSFWWIMSEIFEFDFSSTYQTKTEELKKSGVALWDVLAECQRPKSSLDSKIERTSEIVNDFEDFFQAHPTIKFLGFNGAKAKEIFERHYHTSDILRKHRIKSALLPSTSPANARLSKQNKLEKWQTFLKGPYE